MHPQNITDTDTENFIYPKRTILFVQSTTTRTIIQRIQKDVLGSQVHGMGRKSTLLLFVWSGGNRLNNVQNKRGRSSISDLDDMRHQNSAEKKSHIVALSDHIYYQDMYVLKFL